MSAADSLARAHAASVGRATGRPATESADPESVHARPFEVTEATDSVPDLSRAALPEDVLGGLQLERRVVNVEVV